MKQTPVQSLRSRMRCSKLMLVSLVVAPSAAAADEGGLGFWLSGQFGSLAAAPQQPGWSFADIYYHASVSGSGNVAAAREFTIGAFTRTATVNLNLNVKASLDIDLVSASYVFASPLLGGQLAVGLGAGPGHNDTSLDGTLTVSSGGATATRAGTISDERFGFSDLYPEASLRWNSGLNNFMLYMTGDIPSGTYDSSRLANFGIGHGAADGGVGYTYFDPKTGHEFSIVTGLTGNFGNGNTGYQNGIDWHVDWGASQFLTKQLHIGAVGYFYRQLTGDNGAPSVLGANESQVAGIGPQIGYLFPVGNMQGYLNVKAYLEFDALHRADGWNSWLTFAISPAAPPPPVEKLMPMYTK